MPTQLEFNFEVWKSIPNFPDYSASNMGRIKRTKAGYRTYIGKIIAPYKCHNGYHRVSLYRNRKEYRKRIHSIIMETFIGIKPKGLQVNHKNRIKIDNRLDNLEYVTFQQNMSHACAGEKNPSSKLKSIDVKNIRFLSNIVPQIKIAELYNVTPTNISAIINRKIWNHL